MSKEDFARHFVANGITMEMELSVTCWFKVYSGFDWGRVID